MDFCQTNHQSVPRIILEPGRALTGNAQFLLSRVIGIRKESEFTYLILDAGSSITDPMKDEFHHMIPLERPQEPQVCYRVVGPICHMGDLVALCWRSGTLKPGDAVAIMDSGAYFISEERAFSFPRSGIISISTQGDVKVIRRPEVFSDINNRDLVHLKA